VALDGGMLSADNMVRIPQAMFAESSLEFRFEDLPASNRSVDKVYLDELVKKGIALRHGARRGVYYVPKGGMTQK